MKIGDKVKVIELMGNDSSDTDLSIGSTGEIKGTDGIGTYSVDFGNIRCSGCNKKLDGTYWMDKFQLEVIEENGGTNNE